MTVTKEFKKGYTFRDRLLRPAMVAGPKMIKTMLSAYSILCYLILNDR